MKRGHSVVLALGFCCGLPAVQLHAQPPRGIRIAMVAKSEANFVFLAARKGAEAAARERSQKLGVPIELVWRTPPQESPAAQAERILNAAKEGFDAVLVACSDIPTLTPAINKAVEQGLAVMTFDSDAPDSKRFAFYGPDDGALGEQLVKELATLTGGKGKIAVLAGNKDAPNLIKRADGVRRGAARYPGLEIVEVVYHRETPQDAAAEVLRVNAARGDLAGWAMVGGWPLFRSSQTLRLMDDIKGRGLKVVAIDALPEELSYVERGLVPVLLAQPVYLWGKVGVETIVDKLVSKKQVPERIRMDVVRVSRDNLGTWARQLVDWGFTDVSPEHLKLK